MQKLSFPDPLSCQEVRQLFPALLAEKLGTEQQGRVQGHLLTCEECSVAFAEQIDQALVRGDLSRLPVPPLAVPAVLANVSGRGSVNAWLWEAVRREGKAAMELAQKTASRASVLGIKATELAQRWKEARERLENLELWLQRSLPFWKMAILSPEFGMGATIARGPGESPAVRIHHLDEAWEPTGMDSTGLVEEGPTLTADGKFILTVTTDDKRLNGSRLICSLKLVQEQAIRFEADVEAAGTRWRARFHGEGLPAPSEDLTVSIELVQLYFFPPNK